jgi:multidrug resistance efflux pump
MIFFLLICYVGLLALLVRLRIVQLTLFWKLSPVLFAAVCLVVLIIPLQWGAPSGAANVYRGVVEIIPNITGEVSEVVAKPLEPMKRGEVLFKIDSKLYELETQRLSAALKEAQQAADMLPINLAVAQSNVAKAEITIVEAKQTAKSLQSSLDGAIASVTRIKSGVDLAQENFDRVAKLLPSQSISQAEYDASVRDLDAAKASLAEANALREKAQIALDSTIDGVNTAVLGAEQSLQSAQAEEAKAQLALASTIDGEDTTVLQLRSQLKAAELNLEYCSVRAPSDGYVMGLALRRGQRVANVPLRGYMTFIESGATRLVVSISQNGMRHIQPGQKAEVTFKRYPGQTFSATVESTIDITPAAQLQASGTVSAAPSAEMRDMPFGVVLLIDDPRLDPSSLPGGSEGLGAIYTNSATFAHIVRRIEMRMHSWLNYVIP